MKTLQFLALATVITFTACEKKNDLEAKKVQLAEFKKEAADLNLKIRDLEKQITAIAGNSVEDGNAKLVSTQTITAGTFNHYIDVQGKLDSDKNITITPLAAGRVEKILVTKGQQVKSGQVLARIDGDIYQKGIDELKTQLSFAATVYEKQKKLWDQKIGTEMQYLSAKNNKEGLENKLAILNEQYSSTIIKSTISGTVDEIFLKEGENVAPTTQSFRVVNTADFKIKAEIPESYISKIKQGDAATIYLPDLGDTITTKVKTISDIINPINRSFAIELGIPAKINNLKANMIAYVKIQDYSKPAVISIPVNAVQHGEEGDYVFVANGNTAQKKMITLGNTYRSTVEVLNGLNVGDKLITVGYQELVDGQKIKF